MSIAPKSVHLPGWIKKAVFLAAVTVLLGSGPALAQSKYTHKDLGSISPDGHSQADAVNNSGRATGLSGYGPNAQAFYWNGAVMIGLGALPGHTNSWGHAINNLDEVVGDSWNPATGAQSSFVWDPVNGMRDLKAFLSAEDAARWTLNFANGLNNNGHVTGEGRLDGAVHGFLLDLRTGALTDLGPGSAAGINDGVLPGGSINPNFGVLGWDAELGASYVWRGGVKGPVPMKYASAINNAGAVVGGDGFGGGYYWDGTSAPPRSLVGNWYRAGGAAINGTHIVGTGQKTRLAVHAAVRWKIGDTSPQDLGSLTSGLGKLKLIHANGISGNGYIAGENWDGKNTQHACILIPVP